MPHSSLLAELAALDADAARVAASQATTLAALADAISSEPPATSWFAGTEAQTLSSAATNTIDVQAAAWTVPPTYTTDGFPPIVDNTEGIGAAAHVLSISGFSPAADADATDATDAGANATTASTNAAAAAAAVLVVDLGGGQFDGVPQYIAMHAPQCSTLIADPFQVGTQV